MLSVFGHHVWAVDYRLGRLFTLFLDLRRPALQKAGEFLVTEEGKSLFRRQFRTIESSAITLSLRDARNTKGCPPKPARHQKLVKVSREGYRKPNKVETKVGRDRK